MERSDHEGNPSSAHLPPQPERLERREREKTNFLSARTTTDPPQPDPSKDVHRPLTPSSPLPPSLPSSSPLVPHPFAPPYLHPTTPYPLYLYAKPTYCLGNNRFYLFAYKITKVTEMERHIINRKLQRKMLFKSSFAHNKAIIVPHQLKKI